MDFQVFQPQKTRILCHLKAMEGALMSTFDSLSPAENACMLCGRSLEVGKASCTFDGPIVEENHLLSSITKTRCICFLFLSLYLEFCKFFTHPSLPTLIKILILCGRDLEVGAASCTCDGPISE